jgi:hypothetical protein
MKSILFIIAQKDDKNKNKGKLFHDSSPSKSYPGSEKFKDNSSLNYVNLETLMYQREI